MRDAIEMGGEGPTPRSPRAGIALESKNGTSLDPGARNDPHWRLDEIGYQGLVERIPAIFYVAGLGRAGRWLYVSPQIEAILGYSVDEWCADPTLWFERIHPADREQALADEARTRATSEPLSSEYRLLSRDGTPIWFHDQGTVVEDDSGDEPVLQGVMLDITARKEAEHALEESREATRRSNKQVQEIIDNSPSVIYAKDCSLRYMFVNREFEKRYEVDQDEMLGRTDEEIMPLEQARHVRTSDLRVLESGEVVEEEDLVGADRIYLTQKFPLRDGEGAVYGICGISRDITEHKAKEKELRVQIDWSNRIREAVEQDLLVLHAQPILELSSGQVHQEELLVRMMGRRGVDELIPPGQFLPPAERYGLVHEIDRWVTCEAIKIARDRRVEVNLSGESIGDRRLISLIQSELRALGTDPANLIFEITETAAAKDLGSARAFVQRLTDIGCGFALDDFGTGFSSFNYLKHLPVTFLKIDMEFIRDLAVDPADQRIVKAIIDVARHFGMSTIAEGVEHEATLELLCDLGVNYAQGYLIGKPKPL